MAADPLDTEQLQESFDRRACFLDIDDIREREDAANNPGNHFIVYPKGKNTKAFTIEPGDVLTVRQGLRQPRNSCYVSASLNALAVAKSVVAKQYGRNNEEKAVRALYSMRFPMGIAVKKTVYDEEDGLETVDHPVADLSGIKRVINKSKVAILPGMVLCVRFPTIRELKNRPGDVFADGRITTVLEPFELQSIFPTADTLREVFRLDLSQGDVQAVDGDKYVEAPFLEAWRLQLLYSAYIGALIYKTRGDLGLEPEHFFGFSGTPITATAAQCRLLGQPDQPTNTTRLALRMLLGNNALPNPPADPRLASLLKNGPQELLAHMEANLRNANAFTIGVATSAAPPGKPFDLGLFAKAHTG